ncbi:MAG: ribonuclease III [Cyanophyceae cyanobacterium]
MIHRLPPIRNVKLLNQALTHRSYVNEHAEAEADNERLEFLGDAVLGFIVGELLFRRYPQMNEAELTRLRSKLVDEKQLSQLAQDLGLGEKIRLGKGAQRDGARESSALLSDTFEAIIGAYFLESGVEAVRNYIELLYQSVDYFQADGSVKSLIDFKNRFQQWALANVGENPCYRIINESGPDHAKEFTAQVCVQGVVYGVGQGRRKQEAQKQAAEEALKRLGLE